MPRPDAWSMEALEQALAEYERRLVDAGKERSTVFTYVDQSRRFVRFLAGDYEPEGRDPAW